MACYLGCDVVYRAPGNIGEINQDNQEHIQRYRAANYSHHM